MSSAKARWPRGTRAATRHWASGLANGTVATNRQHFRGPGAIGRLPVSRYRLISILYLRPCHHEPQGLRTDPRRCGGDSGQSRTKLSCRPSSSTLRGRHPTPPGTDDPRRQHRGSGYPAHLGTGFPARGHSEITAPDLRGPATRSRRDSSTHRHSQAFPRRSDFGKVVHPS